MNPTDLSEDDIIGIDDREFRVSSIDVKNIGITEVVAVGLVSQDARYVLTGTTADPSFTLENRKADVEEQVFASNILLVE